MKWQLQLQCFNVPLHERLISFSSKKFSIFWMHLKKNNHKISASEKCHPLKYIAPEPRHDNLHGTLSNTEVIMGTPLYFSCHLFYETRRQQF